MKKFMKVCAVIALILVLLGLTLGIAGSTAKGRTAVAEVVEKVTGGRVHLNLLPGNWGITVGGDWLENLGEVNYDIEEEINFDNRFVTISGDADKYVLEGSVTNLDIEAGGCSFLVETSGDDAFYAEIENAGRFQAYVEAGTLFVKTTTGVKTWNELQGSKVTLYVPADFSFEQVKISLGAGVMKFPKLKAAEASMEVGAGQIILSGADVQSMKVEVGAGQVKLTDMAVTDLQVEVGMGEIVAQGAVNGSLDAECSMGNLELELAGRQTDFNYEMSGAMGSMRLGRENYSGFAQEKNIDNGAEKNIKIECSMGNVSVKFEE